MIVNPMFSLSAREIEVLDAAAMKKIDKSQPKSAISGAARTRFVEEIAERAVTALLAPVAAKYDIRDANALIKRNNPGFDFLARVNGKRIQVKGCSHVDCVDTWVKLDTTHPSYDWDAIIIVDMGVMLPARLRRLDGRVPSPDLKPAVDFYVVDSATFKDWVGRPNRRVLPDGRVCIYHYHYPLKSQTLECQHQEPELLARRNEFGLLNRMFS